MNILYKVFHGQISEIHPTNISVYLHKIQTKPIPRIFLAMFSSALFSGTVLDISLMKTNKQTKKDKVITYSMINYPFV